MRGIETHEERQLFDIERNPFGPWPGGVPGVVRLVRRHLDVSQRGLAARLGVSQSRVARWETGRSSPSAEMLIRLARMAGLQVELRDASGRRQSPLRGDGARDRGRRRYPAHVDIEARGWWLPKDAASRAEFSQLLEDARRRQDPDVRFHTSAWRRHALREAFGQPVDHPSLEQLVAEARHHDEAWLERRDAARRVVAERLRRRVSAPAGLSA